MIDERRLAIGWLASNLLGVGGYLAGLADHFTWYNAVGLACVLVGGGLVGKLVRS